MNGFEPRTEVSDAGGSHRPPPFEILLSRIGIGPHASRLSSDWESTRLKIELSPVQIGEAAYSESPSDSERVKKRRRADLSRRVASQSEAKASVSASSNRGGGMAFSHGSDSRAPTEDRAVPRPRERSERGTVRRPEGVSRVSNRGGGMAFQRDPHSLVPIEDRAVPRPRERQRAGEETTPSRFEQASRESERSEGERLGEFKSGRRHYPFRPSNAVSDSSVWSCFLPRRGWKRRSQTV